MTDVERARSRRSAGGLGNAEASVSWAAVAAAGAAVLAWAACCVLPLSLAVAGLAFGGLSWLAFHRVWLTVAAFLVLTLGWILTWRRTRTCRLERACTAPFRLSVGLLAAATVLAFLALLWQPAIEPWALWLIRSART